MHTHRWCRRRTKERSIYRHCGHSVDSLQTWRSECEVCCGRRHGGALELQGKGNGKRGFNPRHLLQGHPLFSPSFSPLYLPRIMIYGAESFVNEYPAGHTIHFVANQVVRGNGLLVRHAINCTFVGNSIVITNAVGCTIIGNNNQVLQGHGIKVNGNHYHQFMGCIGRACRSGCGLDQVTELITSNDPARVAPTPRIAPLELSWVSGLSQQMFPTVRQMMLSHHAFQLFEMACNPLPTAHDSRCPRDYAQPPPPPPARQLGTPPVTIEPPSLPYTQPLFAQDYIRDIHGGGGATAATTPSQEGSVNINDAVSDPTLASRLAVKRGISKAPVRQHRRPTAPKGQADKKKVRFGGTHQREQHDGDNSGGYNTL